MPVIVPKLKKKNTLKAFADENSIIVAIIADTIKIPNYNILRVDLELIRRICCLIENMIKSGGLKINKKEMCIKIFNQLFAGLTSEEVIIIDKQIEYLWNNNKIKAIPLVKKYGKVFVSWLKKKVA